MTGGRKARYVTRVPVTIHMEAIESRLAELLGIDLSLLLRKALHEHIGSKLESGQIIPEDALKLWIVAQEQQAGQLQEGIDTAKNLLQNCRVPNRGRFNDLSPVLPEPLGEKLYVYDDSVEETRWINKNEYDPKWHSIRKPPEREGSTA